MRIALFFLVGLLLWAGTVSIKNDKEPSRATSTTLACSDPNTGEAILDHMQAGRISGIRDNGQTLMVRLTPEWDRLPSDIQYNTFETVACHAYAQQRVFRFIHTP
jgi:hypothetical protein